MTIFVDSILEAHLGYTAVYLCIGVGFLFLRKVDAGEIGPGYWALGFFFNSAGFLFWSGRLPLLPWQYFLAGEVLHVAGFIMMVCGAYRFSGNRYKPWNAVAGGLWLIAWALSIMLLTRSTYLAFILIKFLRAGLFVFAGAIILARKASGPHFGQKVAGYSLLAWGLYTVILAFVNLEPILNLAYGFLVGFHVLSSFGMVAMVVDRLRIKAEESEQHVKTLEGLLPICSYCKKIRDKSNTWHNLELYIEERSKAEFSHGICPECFEKHRPDR